MRKKKTEKHNYKTKGKKKKRVSAQSSGCFATWKKRRPSRVCVVCVVCVCVLPLSARKGISQLSLFLSLTRTPNRMAKKGNVHN